VNRDTLAIDFHFIRPSHEEVHLRLINWSRWAKGGRGKNTTLPMFQNYRADGYYEIKGGAIPIDSLDATKIQKVFAGMPEQHLWALHWTYLYSGIHVGKVCRVLGMTRGNLSEAIHDARAMVRNRLRATEGI
jgi:hypothetical protein